MTSALVRRVAKGAGIAFIAGTVGGAALLAAEALAARSRRYAKPDLGLAVRGHARPGRQAAAATDAARRRDRARRRRRHGRADRRRPAGPDARRRRRRVALSTVAVAGARSADLATQVARAQLGRTAGPRGDPRRHQRRHPPGPPGRGGGRLATAVRRLRDAGTAVVVGTCPDLGALRAVAPPLRQLVGWYGRRIARAQASAARAAGAAVVDLADPGRTGVPGRRAGCSATTASTRRPTATG